MCFECALNVLGICFECALNLLRTCEAKGAIAVQSGSRCHQIHARMQAKALLLKSAYQCDISCITRLSLRKNGNINDDESNGNGCFSKLLQRACECHDLFDTNAPTRMQIMKTGAGICIPFKRETQFWPPIPSTHRNAKTTLPQKLSKPRHYTRHWKSSCHENCRRRRRAGT